MKCLICETQYNESDQQCRICGFSDSGKIFPTEEDAKYFHATVIIPYRERWKKKKRAEKKIQIDDIITFGRHRWQVLDVQDDKALIITKNIIGKRPYSMGEDLRHISWKTCSLRTYLNSEFLMKLKEDFRIRIETTNVKNNHQLKYNENTIDTVFLLSIEEAKKYFNTNSLRIATYQQKNCNWWLRSLNIENRMGVQISTWGTIQDNCNLLDHNCGIRPALWLNL